MVPHLEGDSVEIPRQIKDVVKAASGFIGSLRTVLRQDLNAALLVYLKWLVPSEIFPNLGMWVGSTLFSTAAGV